MYPKQKPVYRYTGRLVSVMPQKINTETPDWEKEEDSKIRFQQIQSHGILENIDVNESREYTIKSSETGNDRRQKKGFRTIHKT